MQYTETIIGDNIEYAIHILKNKELVAIPTETVYGLAGNAFEPTAIEKIFFAKSRPLNNPLIVHVGSLNQLYNIVTNIPKAAHILLEKYAPGPLTLLLPKSSLIPDIVTAGLANVAVRIPAHPMALALLNAIDFPLAAPSANPFGYISPTTSIHVKNMLDAKIPYILDGGQCKAGIESTIVGFNDDLPIIYRQGVITKEDIETILGKVNIYTGEKIKSSGMMDNHYAPHTPLYLVDDIDTALKNIGNTDIGIITYNNYSSLLPLHRQILLYLENDLKSAANNLYGSLHDMDSRRYAVILVKKLPCNGIGAAINDRLTRAAKK